MNKDLLFQLYCIHSESGNEKKMRKFLRKVAKACGASSVETDRYGNLLIVKGESETYPCLAAHMDQVQRTHSKDFTVVEAGGDVMGYSPKSHEQQGLGADDKNGIFVCLELLKRFDVMKVAFFVGEEVGCQGSSMVDLDFFKDCRFIIEPDRKGSSDLITDMFCGEVCSEDFIRAIGYEKYGYKEDSGTVTDVGELVDRGVGISCLNLSCGYYHAHTDHEITVLSELENCMEFVAHIVETCTDVYPFVQEYSSRGYYGGYGWFRGYGRKSVALSGCKPSSKDNEDVLSYEDKKAYYDYGYYDEDYDKMEEYLQTQPDLQFDTVKSSYAMDFNAPYFLDDYESVLQDIYGDVRWGMERSETVGELFPDMKKVS